MKLQELIPEWPLSGWARGTFEWDNDPGLLKLASVREPGAAGRFELSASDAQLCRWSATLIVEDESKHAAVIAALTNAIGETLADIGQIDIE